MEKLTKKRTDELDKNTFFRRIIIEPDELLINECPYPDTLSREINEFCECECCLDEIKNNCTFFQKYVRPFVLEIDDFSQII